MPNTKSAIRRVRRVKKQTAVNRLRKSKYRSTVKKMEELISSGAKEKIKTFSMRSTHFMSQLNHDFPHIKCLKSRIVPSVLLESLHINEL